ncbi:MAG TPA: YitT family protein [Chloroflexia bacterium]|nr:YitT family protein [Chloroflexia bacterium]
MLSLPPARPAGPLRRLPWSAIRQSTQAYLVITLGTALIALANDLFLIPNNVFSGGVTGIALIVNHYTGWPVGLTYFLLNLPLLLAGLRWLGGARFLMRTLYAVVVLSVLIDALAGVFPPITHEPILYTLYGGLLSGVGGGLVFRTYGTTGGSDIVALLLQRFRGIPLNQSLVGFDVVVYALAALVLGADRALYALIGSFAGSRATALVQEGPRTTRVVYIISAQPDRLARLILDDLHRGVTFLNGSGAYTGADYKIILAVVRQQEINFLADRVHEIDPQAFVIIGDAREVLGEGFSPLAVKR